MTLSPVTPLTTHSRPRLRVLGIVLVALVLVLAMVRAVAWSIADDLAYMDPPAALKVRGGHPLALGSVAEFNWALGRYGIAQDFAKHAVSASPLNGAGYRVLALVAAAKGEQARAAALMQTALQRTPGDLTARRWMAERAQVAGDWRAALLLQDRLLHRKRERCGLKSGPLACANLLFARRWCHCWLPLHRGVKPFWPTTPSVARQWPMWMRCLLPSC